MNRLTMVIAALALANLPLGAGQPPASQAGYDLTGEWAPRFHEDRPERIPGPEIGDYLGLPIPKDKQEGGTYIVPGHGRLSDEADLLEYRDMLTIIRDRVQDLVRKGSTLAQVKAARPTLDYDGRYGAAASEWTTDQFVEAVYRILTTKQPPRALEP
jgi:hypothetical protein